MRIRKIRIISNNICYGPEPSPKDEVEQHLTISSKGRVWFTGYNYADGFGKYKIGRKQQFSIEKKIVDEIFNLFSQYYERNQLLCYATDIGIWKMEITDIENKKYTFKGSLCGAVSVGDTDLTDYIREQIPIDDLFIFDNISVDKDEK
ncbi:hypothetical protein CLHOM_24580 [Clostridium homopropionicum DSM 5847]|uniref:Uncharacterized protein n=1 Tax=Clostridium homopropionicum DSM 5847 TaxID=1121318 RepID=A0A0L6Z8Q6_9CLOT|nr:hypothetical protein [Clostridium homopropionicum]KOA19352.1 hypothetical protein CLHOM_24580 [Clostridium homopropionicum DSM 5847]SFG22139.1 hypothetical protein SAMN04488501_106218 [Clostridium homopropionicum]